MIRPTRRAVLLFALLRKGEVYEPLRNSAKSQAA